MMSEALGKKPKSAIPVSIKKFHIHDDTQVSQVPPIGPTMAKDSNSKLDTVPTVKIVKSATEPQTKLRAQVDKRLISSKNVSKSNKNSKINSNEIWQDEKSESVSQNLQAITNTEQERRRQEMETRIKMLEDELTKMGGLLEKRKKIMEETEEDAKKHQETMEKMIVDQQSLLIKHGVDPVTGEKIILTDDQKEILQNRFTKKKIQEMREKLKDMNEHTKTSLLEIEKTLSDIEDLEKASERARTCSPDTLKILQQLAESGEMSQMEETSQQNLQPPENFEVGSLEEFTMDKFGVQVFLTEGGTDDFVDSEIEIA
ncbi:hypothetical protein Btru_014191 [Bulinus truncatus]|nr:hypothetical protein Btru_014191 [Bulinus truncatus]